MLRAKRLLFFVSVVGFELSLLSHWSMFSNATSVVPQVSRRYMADSYDPIEPTRLGDYKRRLRFVRRSSEIPESPQDSREPVFSSGKFSEKREDLSDNQGYFSRTFKDKGGIIFLADEILGNKGSTTTTTTTTTKLLLLLLLLLILLLL